MSGEHSLLRIYYHLDDAHEPLGLPSNAAFKSLVETGQVRYAIPRPLYEIYDTVSSKTIDKHDLKKLSLDGTSCDPSSYEYDLQEEDFRHGTDDFLYLRHTEIFSVFNAHARKDDWGKTISIDRFETFDGREVSLVLQGDLDMDTFTEGSFRPSHLAELTLRLDANGYLADARFTSEELGRYANTVGIRMVSDSELMKLRNTNRPRSLKEFFVHINRLGPDCLEESYECAKDRESSRILVLACNAYRMFYRSKPIPHADDVVEFMRAYTHQMKQSGERPTLWEWTGKSNGFYSFDLLGTGAPRELKNIKRAIKRIVDTAES